VRPLTITCDRRRRDQRRASSDPDRARRKG